MELIQLHERAWGMEQYGARPSLSDLLQRPIVVFWTGDDKAGKGRFTLSVHNEVEELNSIILSMILSGKVTASSNRKLSKIFVNQKLVNITGVRLLVAQG